MTLSHVIHDLLEVEGLRQICVEDLQLADRGDAAAVERCRRNLHLMGRRLEDLLCRAYRDQHEFEGRVAFSVN